MATAAFGLALGTFICLLVFFHDLHERLEYIEDRLDRYFDMLTRARERDAEKGEG
jgi:hypothetical protein